MRFKHLLCSALLASLSLFADALDDGFAQPPNSAKPQAWWHWMHCNITKEGLTADLEAMAKVGIGGATILDISDAIPAGNVHSLSPEWYDMVEHALNEAERLGLELSFHNCPGWSSSGGPWITQEHAMKRISYSETYAQGGKQLKLKLNRPYAWRNYYKDIAVLAFPSLPGDGVRFQDTKGVKVSTNLENQDANLVFRNPGGKILSFRPGKKTRYYVQYEFAEPYPATTVNITLQGSSWRAFRANLLVSDDGATFKPLLKNMTLRANDNTMSFPLTNLKYVRLDFMPVSDPFNMSRFSFSRHAQIPYVKYKMSDAQGGSKAWGEAPAPEYLIKQKDIQDISKFMDKDGNLAWNAPAGNWTIVRIGYTLTGRYNHPTTKWGRGLECDKMSKEAVKVAWDGMMQRIADSTGKARWGKALKGTLIDSYEVGPQNWTPTFREDFKRLRGYDCITFLPIITGRYIESQEYTERFMQDMRRTVADLFAECYADYFNQLAKQCNLDFMSEPYGGPFDNLRQGRSADIPMGEFWGGGFTVNSGNSRLAANIAQVNGRTYVGTESFTANPKNGRWLSYPGIHKAQGDNAFCNGINRFIFHDYAHQPWNVKGPGMTMGQWGFHFNRHNTLWNDYPGWLSYLARSQFLLQQGNIVSDALYVATEDAPCSATFSPAVPRGYHSNCIDAQSFIERLTVTPEGRVALPHGISFPLLVLNETKSVTPKVLRKALALAEQGATLLLGPRPEHTFGLTDYPQSDAELKQLVQKLWSDLDGKAKTKHSLGKGTVYMGVIPQTIFQDIKLKQDFAATYQSNPVNSVSYIHRKTDDTHIYFVANIGRTSARFNGWFRVAGLIPELWDPMTGNCSPAPFVQYEQDGTKLDLKLDQSGSIFVIFRKPRTAATTCTTATWTPAKTSTDTNSLTIHKAIYKAVDDDTGRDVTKHLQPRIIDGVLNIQVENGNLGGDPTPMRVKELVIDFTYNGKRQQETFAEHNTVIIPQNLATPATVCYKATDKGLAITAWQNGTSTLTMSDKQTKTVVFNDIPAPIFLNGAWNVSFPKGWNAPESIDFPQLMSYTQHDNPGIKYFSGTATYKKTIDLPATFTNRPVLLDLGTVMVMARVYVNGEYCGLYWSAPFRMDVGSKLKPGSNTIEVRVTNRWVNRLIGDEQLPDDSEWSKPRSQGGRQLVAWPKWFKEGKPSPTGRLAFTTYKHWEKDDKLLDAGLIGPVKLIPGKTQLIK